MIGVLGHDCTLLRLYWAGDKVGLLAQTHNLTMRIVLLPLKAMITLVCVFGAYRSPD